MKKTILHLLCLISLNAYSQDWATETKEHESSFYIGIGPAIPTGDFSGLLPNRFGLLMGNQFYFINSGFVNGLLNVGVDFTWFNLEMNAGLADDAAFYLRQSAAVGPLVTVKPINRVAIDAFVKFGYGARLGGDQITTNFVTNTGVNFRFQKVFLGLGINSFRDSGPFAFHENALQVLFGFRSKF